VTGWSDDELERLGTARELRIAGRRADGGLRTPVIIWAVRVGHEVYLRSVRGPAGAWFTHVLERHEGRVDSGGVEQDVVVEEVAAGDPVNDLIDAAYADKYGAGSGSVRAITSDLARGTTLRITPQR
jgi:hypothetical protein